MQRRAFLRSSVAAAAGIAVSARTPLHALHAPHAQTPRLRREVVALTGEGREVTLTDAMLKELADSLRGRLLLRATPATTTRDGSSTLPSISIPR